MSAPPNGHRAPFPDQSHDHGECIEEAFARAERICSERGVRLTDLRRAVLQAVWRSHAPIGAYEILDSLKEEGRRAAPMTVHRALDFLIENGLVHRLASQNAFLGCDHPEHAHRGQFLICRSCGVVGELSDDNIFKAICDSARKTGFSVEVPMVEVIGLCRQCADNAPADADE